MNSNESIIRIFQINRKKEGQKGQSPVPPSADEPVSIAAGGYFGTYVDTDATARNEFELIRRYRDMSLHPEVDSAVDEIVNEFVVSDANDSCVEVDLNNLEVGAGVKKKIRDEFDKIKQMLNFDNRSHEIIRSWYIDGKLYYHKVIDLDNPKKGILELRYIDPLKIRKVRQNLERILPKTQELIEQSKELPWNTNGVITLITSYTIPKDIYEAGASVLSVICQTPKELRLLPMQLHSVPQDYKILTRECT